MPVLAPSTLATGFRSSATGSRSTRTQRVHDDVSPIDAPRRASWRPGLYLSHVPGIPRLDVRVAAASTDPPITNSNGGHFMYYEFIQQTRLHQPGPTLR